MRDFEEIWQSGQLRLVLDVGLARPKVKRGNGWEGPDQAKGREKK